MALELDWRACEEDTFAQAFGFYMMFTEMGWELDEKNIEEFYCRVKFHEKLMGPIYYYDDKPIDITPTLIKKYVGLRANIAPRTFNQFAMNLVSRTREDFRAEFKKELSHV